MNKKQLSQHIGNIDDRLVQKAEKVPNYAKENRQKRLRQLLTAAAAFVLMVSSFSVGAIAFAREIIVEVPAAQEQVELEEFGLTLVSSGRWKVEDKVAFSKFNARILDTAVGCYEDGGIRQEDIVFHRIYYGHFSRSGAKELLLLCKILNLPHVAGLDKTTVLLLNADTLELTAYAEFSADHVTLEPVQTSAGVSRLLYIGTTIYQGIAAQEVQLWTIQNGQWEDHPIEYLETLSDDCFCFMGDGEIIVSSAADHAYITAILSWDPDAGQFVP